jgi:hypothetical protein
MQSQVSQILEAKLALEVHSDHTPPVLNPEFLDALNKDMLESLDPEELTRFTSVLEAARVLSEGTYKGTVPCAHGERI